MNPRGTVLLVKENTSVRHSIAGFLRSLGYTVLESQYPNQAIYLCERYPGAIGVLMTDSVLHEITGEELARLILEIRPGITVLYADNRARTNPVDIFTRWWRNMRHVLKLGLLYR